MDNKIPDPIKNVLQSLYIDNPVLLGKGGEGYIFSYTNDTVVKIYLNTNETYLEELSKFQSFLTKQNLPFTTPLTEEIGCIYNTYYTIEKRLIGISMEQKFSTLTEKKML